MDMGFRRVKGINYSLNCGTGKKLANGTYPNFNKVTMGLKGLYIYGDLSDSHVIY